MAHCDKSKFYNLQKESFEKMRQNIDMDSRSSYPESFMLDNRDIGCIDEGVTHGDLRLAGSGILLDEKQFEKYLQVSGAEGIYSHEGCGAAGIYTKLHGLDSSRSDEYGKEFSARMAEKFGIRYRGHISFSDMKRPAQFHTAMITYYDGTGIFNPSKSSKLLNGFVIQRKYLPMEYALKEVEVSISIAFGDHGMSEFLTDANPYLICVVGDAVLEPEIRSFLETNEIAKNYLKRIQIIVLK